MGWRAAWCVALLGCGGGAAPSGALDAGTAELAPDGDAAVATFACGESSRAEPATLRRLTMTQYRNTLRDLTRWALGDVTEADAALALAQLDRVPLDRREPTPNDPRGGMRRLDQALEQAHVDETFRVAAVLGAALTTPARLAMIAGVCATDSDVANDDACVASFIQRFGARALRRPLDADDERFYRAVFGSDSSNGAAGYRDVITVLLSAPELLYFVEHGASEVLGAPGRYQLSAHELASRLSYHFWQTLPDDALWQAAEDGSLLDPDVLAREVERLLSDPRAAETMAELFSDWLGLDDVPELDAFAGELRQHAIDEALELLAYYTWTDPAGIEALLTSQRSFARTDDLASIYGASERPGMLSRVWFLASSGASTRPIQRGVRIRRTLLCDELAPPPANVGALLPSDTAGKTTRQAVEELTEQPGTVCASCHATQINPLGFAFEGFDALGRARAAGTFDVRSVPRVTPDDERSSSGPSDLVRYVLESGKVEACLARNYFRFAFGRVEDLGRDGCALERLRARLTASGRTRDMLEEAALLPEMRERSFEP